MSWTAALLLIASICVTIALNIKLFSRTADNFDMVILLLFAAYWGSIVTQIYSKL